MAAAAVGPIGWRPWAVRTPLTAREVAAQGPPKNIIVLDDFAIELNLGGNVNFRVARSRIEAHFGAGMSSRDVWD